MNFIYGIISGIATSIGLGGGTVIIILLTVFEKVEQKMAQGINLVFFIPTSIITIYFFIKNKQLKVKENLLIIIGGILGAYLGAKISCNLNNELLKKVFAIFILLIALFEIIKYFRKYNKYKKQKIIIKQ